MLFLERIKNVKYRVVISTCKRSLACDYLITFLDKIFQNCSGFYFTFICIFVAMLWLLCSHVGNANHLWFMGHLDCICSCFVSSEQWKAAETDSSTLCFLCSKFLLICHPPTINYSSYPLICIPLSWLYPANMRNSPALLILPPLSAKLVLNSGGETSCQGHLVCWGWQQNLPALPPSYLVP